MSTITWTPFSGAAITFSRPNYFLPLPDNLGGIPLNMVTLRAPYQHGATLIDRRHLARDIPLNPWVITNTETLFWARRQELVEAFSARLGKGRLTVIRPGLTTVEIEGFPVESPEMPETPTLDAWRAMINIFCPYPYWRDNTQGSQLFTIGQALALTNNGKIPSPVTIVFNGPAFMPSMTIASVTPQEIIQLNHTLVSGEVVTVTAGPGAPTVTRTLAGVTTGAQNLLVQASMFWSLRPGSNTVGYHSLNEGQGGHGTATVTWRHWREGI